jgi:hypothetical protein
MRIRLTDKCDLILYFRLGRVGKKWEEMGRDWI